MAYASAYDAWLDPEAERKNPTPEYAELIRQAVSFENEKLRELCKQMYPRAKAFLQMGVQLGCNDTLSYDWEQQMRELGVELPK
jgi:hypothetical protein